MLSEHMRNRKILYILLAMLVSIVLWLYVDMFGNNGGPFLTLMTVSDIPIEYDGEDELADRGLMLMDENTSTTVDLTFEGARMLVVTLDREDIKITADLSTVETAGIQTIRYDIAFTDIRFSTSMIEKRSIYSATVNIMELNSKSVPVVCDLVGNVAEGYSAGQLQLSQETVEIRGQAEDIDPISYVKVTLDIGEDAVETVSQDLSFEYYDENDQLLEPTGMHPTVDTVKATLPVFVTKELTLVVDFLESAGARTDNLDYEIKPKTITVSGDAGLLRDIETITLGQLNLLDLLGSGASSHTFPIIIPEGCENLSGVTRATLDVEFKDMSRAEVTTENFEASGTNLLEGKRVTILTEQLTVSLFGTEADVAAVTGDDITVIADLSNYSSASGTYTVPAEIRVETDGDVGVSGTYHVQVTIREDTGESDQPNSGTFGE